MRPRFLPLKTLPNHTHLLRQASPPVERICLRPAPTAAVAPGVGTCDPSHHSVTAGNRQATYQSRLVGPQPGSSGAVYRHALSHSAVTLRYEVYLSVVYSVKLLELPNKRFDQPLIVVVGHSSCARALSRLCLPQNCHYAVVCSTGKCEVVRSFEKITDRYRR